MEEAEKLAKSKEKSRHPESCEEIKKLNDKRKALKPVRTKSKINQIEYTELNKTIRKMRRKKKREFRTRMVKEVLESNKIICHFSRHSIIKSVIVNTFALSKPSIGIQVPEFI